MVEGQWNTLLSFFPQSSSEALVPVDRPEYASTWEEHSVSGTRELCRPEPRLKVNNFCFFVRPWGASVSAGPQTDYARQRHARAQGTLRATVPRSTRDRDREGKGERARDYARVVCMCVSVSVCVYSVGGRVRSAGTRAPRPQAKEQRAPDRRVRLS